MSGETSTEVSVFRLHSMRAVYALTFLAIGYDVWPRLLRPAVPLAPLEGVALSFWVAYSGLMLLGLRHPLKMLPLMLLQMVYKVVWLLTVALPLSSRGPLDAEAGALTTSFLIAIVIDLIVVPWPHVWSRYATGPGERWR